MIQAANGQTTGIGSTTTNNGCQHYAAKGNRPVVRATSTHAIMVPRSFGRVVVSFVLFVKLLLGFNTKRVLALLCCTAKEREKGKGTYIDGHELGVHTRFDAGSQKKKKRTFGNRPSNRRIGEGQRKEDVLQPRFRLALIPHYRLGVRRTECKPGSQSERSSRERNDWHSFGAPPVLAERALDRTVSTGHSRGHGGLVVRVVW